MDAITFSGRKGSDQTNTSDNLFSTDNVEVVLGISEGPIEGLENNGQSFLIGDTPLTAPDGSSNLTKFRLTVNRGGPNGEKIKSLLGGFGGSTNVGLNLLKDTAVVRTGTTSNIDYLDVRLAIQALYETNKNGTFGASMTLKIEYKAVSSSTWLPATAAILPPLVEDLGDSVVVNQVGGAGDVSTLNYFSITVGDNFPSSPGANDLHLKTDDRVGPWDWSRPYRRIGNAWVNDVGASGTINNGALGYLRIVSTGGRLFYTPTNDHTWADLVYAIGSGAKINDVILDPVSASWLVYNGSTWARIYRPSSAIENPSGGGVSGTTASVNASGVITITGKLSSTYIKELRIPVARINEPYQIRITKTSRDSKQEGDNTYGNSCNWESFQEVTAREFLYPNLASVHLVAKATGQFSSIPDFSGIYKGRVIKVPSNYNPTTKVYTGVWDGIWVQAWTSNPAFIVKDLVENDRYGMNAYYPVVLDDMSVYLAGQHCDEYGFTYNGLLSDARLGKEAVNYMCGLFGGRFVDDGNGSARILLDRNTSAVYLFAPENVVDGLFSYSFSEMASRFNDVTVTFTNPDLNWQEDRVRIVDQDHIDKYGRITTDFIAVGCTSREEAIRRGRLHMVTALTEKTIATFKTNRAGLYLEPYDIVLICDETIDAGQSGRVISRDSATTLTLRDAIYLEPGFTYKLTIQEIGSVSEFTITSASGSRTQLTVSGTLPTGIEERVVTIGTTGQQPKAYRIISLSETDNPDNISVSAVEVNRNKWTFVTTGVTVPDVDTAGPKTGAAPSPPSNLKLAVGTRELSSRLAQDLLATWDPPSTGFVKRYNVYHQINSGVIQNIGSAQQNQFEIKDIEAAIHRIGVSSLNLAGAESTIVWAEHDVIGSVQYIPSPTNFRLTNGTSQFEFAVLSPTVSWEAPKTALLAGYEIEVRDPISNALLYTQKLGRNIKTFTYDYELNKTHNAGVPRRAVLFALKAVSESNQSSQWVYLQATNPQVLPPANITTTPLAYAFTAIIPRPADPDYAGVRIYADETSPPTTLRYEGADLNYTGVLMEGVKLYVRVALYDSFRSDDALLSNVFEVTGSGLAPGTISWDHLSKELYRKIDFDPVINQVADYTSEVRQRLIEIKSETDGNLASVTETVEARTGPNGSMTTLITDSQSKIGDTVAARTLIQNVTQASVDGSSLSAIISTLGNSHGAIRQTVSSQTDKLGQITNQWVVSMQARGTSGIPYISGFGMVQATGTNLATPTSTFAIAADQFVIGPPSSVGSNSADWNTPVPLLSFDTNTKIMSLNGSIIVGGNNIPNGVLNGAKITPGTIAGDRILGNTITGDKIVGNTITGDKLVGNSITGDKIVGNSITGDKINGNTITAANIVAGTLTYDKLNQSGNGVVTENIAPNSATRLITSSNATTVGFSAGSPETPLNTFTFNVAKTAWILFIVTAAPTGGQGGHNQLWRLYINNAPYAVSYSFNGSPLAMQFVIQLGPSNYDISLTGQGNGGNGGYSWSNYIASVFQSIR